MASLWDELRRDFPALSRCVYLNTAAAGPIPRQVRAAVDAFHRQLEEGGDRAWGLWIDRREQVRGRLAAMIGASADEVAFVPNTSVGINLIADLVAADGPVLSDELEFPTVTLPFVHRGVPVHLVPAVEGIVREESFAVEHAPRAATLALSHVQFSNGCRLDLDAFGRLKAGRHLVVSASQSAGVFPIDVGRSGVDALASAGHKWMCAGYGAGFVYVCRRLLERPPHGIGWLSVEDPFAFDNRSYRLRPQASRVEMGCPSFAPIFALGAAVEYLTAIGIPAIAGRALELNLYLTSRLESRGFEVLSPSGPHRSAQALVAVPQPSQAVRFLRERDIHVTRKPEGVRVATHFFNDERDIDRCVRALIEYRSAQRTA